MNRMLYWPPGVGAASARGWPEAAEGLPLPSTPAPLVAATAVIPIIFRASLRSSFTPASFVLALVEVRSLRLPPSIRLASDDSPREVCSRRSDRPSAHVRSP